MIFVEMTPVIGVWAVSFLLRAVVLSEFEAQTELASCFVAWAILVLVLVVVVLSMEDLVSYLIEVAFLLL